MVNDNEIRNYVFVQKSLAEPQLHGLSAPCRRCFSPTLPEVSPTCIYCPAGAICTEK